MSAVFEALAGANINVYLIKVQEEYLGFSVSSDDTEAAIAVLQQSHLRYGLSRDCAIVSVVSPAMRDLSGILWRIIGSLRDADVEILELADAYNAVSCLIAEADCDRAVAALAATFGVGLDTDPLDPW
jgi:aspartate kinase